MIAKAAWTIGVAVAAGLVSRAAVGDAFFVGRYLGYGMPWLLVPLVPAVVFAIATRRHALAALLGASALAIVALHAPRPLPRAAPSASAGTTLTVMSFNTFSRNGDVAAIAAVVRGVDPELLLLQEIPPEVFAALAAALERSEPDRPLHAVYAPSIGQGVLSRFPVEPRATLARMGNAQVVSVRTPEGPITVFNVHPLRTGGWRHRYGEIAALLERHVLLERDPVILGGDLNANEHTELYGLLSRHLVNAHDRAGRGFGFTWPSGETRVLGRLPVPGPMVRIDHLFLGPGLDALRAGTLAGAGGSDHRPVFAVLSVAPQPVRAAPAVGRAD